MTLTRFARKARTIMMAGLTALAGTTFQNGCGLDIPTAELSSLLSTFESDFYSSDPYSDWDYGYDSYDSYDSYDNYPSGWDLLDLKSG